MKRVLLASAAVVGFIAATPASALNDHHGQVPDDGSAQARAWNGQQNGNGSPPATGSAGGTHNAPGSGGHHDHGTSTAGGGSSGGSVGADTHHHDHHSNASNGVNVWTGGDHDGDHRDHGNSWNGHNHNDAGWHNGHNDNWGSYRRVWSAPRRFHWGSYHHPYGWHYQRWTIGAFLPALYYTHNYWIDDYADLALDDPPPGTVWVRYGSDALLIDEYSGEVIQVVYGIFY